MDESILTDRAGVYRFLAGFYYAPLTEAQIDELAALDFTALAANAQADGDMARGLDDMRRALRRRNTGTREKLAVDYTNAFLGVKPYQDMTAVPYASIFVDKEGRLNTEQRGKVYAAYKHEALRLRENVNIPEDHLSLMLEFLALMSERARDEVHAGRRDEAARLLSLSATFVREHILSWIDDFAETASHVLETRFYRGVIELTRGFLTEDLETLSQLVEELGGVHVEDAADAQADEDAQAASNEAGEGAVAETAR